MSDKTKTSKPKPAKKRAPRKPKAKPVTLEFDGRKIASAAVSGLGAKLKPKSKKKAKAPDLKSFIPDPIDPKQLQRLARQVVLGFADKGEGTGPDKHAAAVKALARKVDSMLVWPATPMGAVAEVFDGIAAKILLGGIVKHAYKMLKSEGKIL